MFASGPISTLLLFKYYPVVTDVFVVDSLFANKLEWFECDYQYMYFNCFVRQWLQVMFTGNQLFCRFLHKYITFK